jgi:aldose sugar dehydrogenase
MDIIIMHEEILFGTCLITASVSIVILLLMFLDLCHTTAFAAPSILGDSHLKVDSVTSGLSSPTSMAFIDDKNILILEKSGQVRLILNGVLEDKPILEVPVDITSERGLLGIAIMNEDGNNDNNNTNAANISGPVSEKTKTVFLYYTESKGGELLGNRIYKYEWNGQNLINPKLILDLPALDGPNHDGGKLTMGPDNYLYAIIGDLNHRGKLQNIKEGPDPDNTSVIFRINRSY